MAHTLSTKWAVPTEITEIMLTSLNPIKHACDMHSRRIRSLVPTPGALDELWRTLLDQWAAIPQENISHLVESMLKRMNAVIQACESNTHF